MHSREPRRTNSIIWLDEKQKKWASYIEVQQQQNYTLISFVAAGNFFLFASFSSSWFVSYLCCGSHWSLMKFPFCIVSRLDAHSLFFSFFFFFSHFVDRSVSHHFNLLKHAFIIFVRFVRFVCATQLLLIASYTFNPVLCESCCSIKRKH